MSNQPDYSECYKSAFAIGLSEIEGGDGVIVADLFSGMDKNSGDLRKQAIHILTIMGTQNWKWRPFNYPLSCEKDYKKMATEWARRIEALAHALYRREQLSNVSKLNRHPPY